MWLSLTRLSIDDRGATAVEYGLICAMIVLAMVGGLSFAADVTTNMWNGVSDSVQKS